MKCEIISIGDELLIGQTVNTNASWIGEKMNYIGVDIIHCSVISDDKSAIVDALDQGSKRADVVIITGGLGPTNDDITKHTLCDYFNTNLILHSDIEDKIITYFKDRDLPILQSNKDQALLPESCLVLSNSRGTASGMWFKKDNVIYVSLPGVPYEMKGIMNDHVFSKLIQLKGDGDILINQTVRTHGLGESFLADIIKEWELYLKNDGIKLAYLPSPGIVKLRLTAIGKDSACLNAKLTKHVIELKKLIPDQIYGYNNELMEHVVGDLLNNNNSTVSLAESCTGGSVAKMLVSKSGSSTFFKGSVITYSYQSKEDVLGVDKELLNSYGAVSKQVVEQMAIGVKEIMKTDYGLATSGIAGPTGGTEDKPVGTVWIAVATPDKVISKKLNLGYNRERNIHVSSLSVLNLLRLELLKS